MQKPAWAKALIVAVYHTDESDMQTDYFNVRHGAPIALAWSKHTRDNFAEMRKAAELFEPTKHLGRGCDVWHARVVRACDVIDHGSAYWKGSVSHWHSELMPGPRCYWPEFTTEAEAQAYVSKAGEPNSMWFGETLVTFAWSISRESIEHREKYSMGKGYYLKGSGSYSSGWTVSKMCIGERTELVKWYTDTTPADVAHEDGTEASAQETAQREATAVNTIARMIAARECEPLITEAIENLEAGRFVEPAANPLVDRITRVLAGDAFPSNVLPFARMN